MTPEFHAGGRHAEAFGTRTIPGKTGGGRTDDDGGFPSFRSAPDVRVGQFARVVKLYRK
jgi:hypothetical protein